MTFKTIGILAAVGAALLAIGYVSGRYMTPAKVVEKEKLIERHTIKEVAVLDKQLLEETIKSAVSKAIKQNDIKWKERIERRPDGTVIEERETEDKSREEKETKTDEKTTKIEKVIEIQYRDVIKEKIVEKLKIVEVKPDWIIGANAGISVPSLLRDDQFRLVKIPGGVIFGVDVDRRILGDFYLGAWANSMGAIGLGAKLTF